MTLKYNTLFLHIYIYTMVVIRLLSLSEGSKSILTVVGIISTTQAQHVCGEQWTRCKVIEWQPFFPVILFNSYVFIIHAV